MEVESDTVHDGSVEESKEDFCGLESEGIDVIQESRVESSEAVEVKEKKMREINGAFGLLKDSAEEWCCKLDLKEKELEEWVAKLESERKKVELRFEELNVIEKRVGECLSDGEFKEKLSVSLQKSVDEREKHLGLLFRGLKTREKELEMRKQQIESDYNVVMMKEIEVKMEAQEVELKRQQIDSLCHLFLIKEGQLEKQAKDLESKHRALRHQFQVKMCDIENQAQVLEFKRQQNDSVAQLLQIKERGLEQQVKDNEFKQQHIDSIWRTLRTQETKHEQQEKEFNLKQKLFDSQVKMTPLNPAANTIVPSSASDVSGCGINVDGRGLQLIVYEQMKRTDLMRSQMLAALQVSSDPGKLVLDAMQGFYLSKLIVENCETEFDLTFIRKSCILLLKELKRMSLQISPPVREEALELAADWKAKMTVACDNTLEVLGFLWLVAAYELTSSYDMKELQILVSKVARPKQVAQLRMALGVVEKTPDNIISLLVKVEEPNSSLATNATTVSSKLQPNANMDASNVLGFDIEPLSGHSQLADSRHSVPFPGSNAEQRDQRKRKKPYTTATGLKLKIIFPSSA